MHAQERLAVLTSHLFCTTIPRREDCTALPASSTLPQLCTGRCRSAGDPASKGSIVVIGGIVLDIQAKPFTDGPDILRASSVPGKVLQVPGGVGRNIADGISQLVSAGRQSCTGCCSCCNAAQSCSRSCSHAPSAVVEPGATCDAHCSCSCTGHAQKHTAASCAAQNGVQRWADRPHNESASLPAFISVVGNDGAGQYLLASLHALRLDSSAVTAVEGARTPCVAAVIDRSGEVAACVADVAAVEEQLTPQLLTLHQRTIQQASMLVVETNLAAAALVAACSMAAASGVPILLEPVSVPKSTRCVPVLRHLSFLTPNLAELVAIADVVRQQQHLGPLPRPQLPACLAVPSCKLGPLHEEAECSGQPLHSPCQLHQHSYRQHPLLQQQQQQQQTKQSFPHGSLHSIKASLQAPADAAPAPIHGSSTRGAMPTAQVQCTCSRPSTCHATEGPWSHAGSSGCAQTAEEELALQLFLQPVAAFAAVLLQEGVQTVALTLGSLGAALIRRQSTEALSAATDLQSGQFPANLRSAAHGHVICCVQHMQAAHADVVSLSGAGDTLVAGLVAALSSGMSPMQALAMGMATAKQAVQSADNVPSDLTLRGVAIEADAARIVGSLRQYSFPVQL